MARQGVADRRLSAGADAEELDELRAWVTLIAGRYVGHEQAEAFGQRNGVPGEILVRVQPIRIIGQRNITG